MSSREIAELTGKSHDNVRRDIQRMAAELSLTFEKKVLESTGGRPSVVYLLQRREVEILLTGYSVPLRAKVIDRWRELEAQAEAQQSPKLPTTFAEALGLAAELEEPKEQLRLQNEAMKPAAEVGAAVGKRTNYPQY